MTRETHIARFKVVSIECASMPNGQQYTIFYRRGDTSRSTPCYVAQDGVADFSAMPEGAAVIHFKPGRMGRRYAPKYLQFRVEEYTRGAPRRTVGECEVDCSQTLQGMAMAGSGIQTVLFRMYGVAAKMKVAILMYPEHAPPLTFDGLITPTDAQTRAPAMPKGDIKVMGRGEAMTLLISLETMLERRRQEEALGKTPAGATRAERRLKELEEKRKTLTGTEGLASAVITARTHDVVHAQFVALARKYRNNFVGETAAYLRQMAITSGMPMDGEDLVQEGNEETLRLQLQQVTTRIGELQQQMRRLEEEQTALGRIQHKTDVTAELCANLDKVSALDAQVKILEQSRAALAAAVKGKEAAAAATANSPLAREVKEIEDCIAAAKGKQGQLEAKVRHMAGIASAHVLSWARAKNPPTPEPTTVGAAGRRNDIDDLFSQDTKGTAEQMINEAQRKQILSAFEGLRATAPEASSPQSPSSGSSSGHRTPRDLFSGQEDLPSMGDFGASKAKPKKEPEPQKEKPKPEAPKYQDPLKPGGLGMGMFADDGADGKFGGANAHGAGLPSMGDFMSGTSAKRNVREETPTFDFNTVMQAAGGGAGFVLEPQGQSMFATAPSGAVTQNATRGAAAPTPYNPKTDDPFYDEMDDFTVPPDTQMGVPATIEFADGFGGFGAPSSPGPSSTPQAQPRGAAMNRDPPPRPTFNFGSQDDGGEDDNGSGEAEATAGFTFSPAAAGAYDFGSGAPDGGSGKYAGISNLPTYNFGS